MEKLTLIPNAQEIIVNNGTGDGAVDLFSYTPDDASSRALGALYILGYRDTDSSNMGYMVSLIAALARREYYAQPGAQPREAFARTLRKANEVVEEFFRNGEVKLSVGIVAVSGGTIMVSKLDKFKILLARENQVIDVMSNVGLFSKEHGEKRKFSSVIHGSVQAGDRILAFVPTRAITARERSMRGWLLKLPQDEFTQRVEHIGAEHASFATAMLHIAIAQTVEPTVPEPTAPVPAPVPELAPQLAASPIPWKPRQAAEAVEPEVPRIISSEFSLGTRRTNLSRWLNRIRLVRLDRRGKATALVIGAAVLIGIVFTVKTVLFVDPQQQKEQQALQTIKGNLDLARAKIAQNETGAARQILAQALSALIGAQMSGSDAKDVEASLTTTLDSVDNAQSVTPTLLASPQPDTPAITLTAWSSASQTVWVGGVDAGTVWAAPLSLSSRTPLGIAHADVLLGWNDSVLAVNIASRSVVRPVNGTYTSYVIPTQDTVLDAEAFNDNLYVLTDKSILKISDLDTQKPVTKQWLTDEKELASGAAHLWVDSNVWTMSADGTLTTYYKGKKTTQASTALALSGTWRLMNGPEGTLAVAAGQSRRIYLVNPANGTLARTLKLDSDVPYTYLSPGPDNSVLLLTNEGKLWQVK